jgi:hypothetical protein
MRIGDFQMRTEGRGPDSGSGSATRSAQEPVEPPLQAGPGFWDSPAAAEEAGQDKLRSAVEWGLFHRHAENLSPSRPLLNLKPSASDAFFLRGNAGVPRCVAPDLSSIESAFAPHAEGGLGGIFAFDFFQLHPDWRRFLALASRSLADDGTLYLNSFSEPHFRLAPCIRTADGSSTAEDAAAFPHSTADPGHIAATAEGHGLRLVDVVPYSSFYGSSLWLETIRRRARWERILDWLTSDRQLFEFALFLEERVIARMGAEAAPRFAMILRKGRRNGVEARPVTEPAPLSASRCHPFSVGALAQAARRMGALGTGATGSDATWSRFLAGIRNRVFFQRLLESAGADMGDPLWSSILPDQALETFRIWQRQDADDGLALRLIRDWQRLPEVDATLRHRGVPLCPGLEYEQVTAVLKGVFGYFRKDLPA